MSLKKMLMLASMALAAMAFAAPAAQAGLDWDETGTIEGTGTLTSVAQIGLATGPAEVHFAGSVVEGSSTGLIEDFEITGPVPVEGVENCHAEASVDELPWLIHLTTPDTMTITDVTFKNDYTGAGCAPAGVPPSAAITGDVTLTVTGTHSADADPYVDFGTLFIEGTPIGVDIQGSVEWVGPGITGL